MCEVKPHLSYEKQMNKLREKECLIADDSFCESILLKAKDCSFYATIYPRVMMPDKIFRV